MVISKNYIEKYSKNNKKIINAGRLSWAKKNYLSVYNTKVDDPYGRIVDSKIIYEYKIINNKMYITKDKKDWDILKIKIVEGENFDNGVPVYMVIHLKCKWFEGEYEIIGTTG